MSKHYLSLCGLALLMAALWLSPLQALHAAEDPEATTETTETTNPRGPGAVILMLGLGAVVLVGGAYVGGQSKQTPSNE